MFRFRGVAFAFPAIMAVIGLAACSPADNAPGDTEKVATPPVQEVAPTPTTAVPEPATPEVEPAKRPAKPAAPLFNVELLRNGNFERWENDLPMFWEETHAETVAVQRTGTEQGKCLQLTPMKDQWTGVWQRLAAADARARGKEVEVTARMRGWYQNMVVLDVSYLAGGEKRSERVPYTRPKNATQADWQTVTVKTKLPDNFDPRSLTVAVVARPNPEGRCFVDGVTAKISE